MIPERIASAKVNLALHVLGQRPDGFHEISSLVVFTTFGDVVSIASGNSGPLSIRGPFGHCVPHDQSNLACRALALLGCADKVTITLDKQIPVEAGLGGGSSDAASVILMAARLFNLDIPDPAAIAALGSDVPVCLFGRSALVGGLGEQIKPVESLPDLFLVLVNPMFHLATRDVYHAVKSPSGRILDMPPANCDLASLAAWLHEQANDLETAAIALAPCIADVLAAIRKTTGCLLARMSGSGATCYGLYQSREAAQTAARAIAASNESWWVQETQVTSQSDRV
ncbi:MAG: 4-(cytidine 5'-diphospho)-2-C-methyl-D-erythritol kinase [Rhodobacteraceae bacterium]|nr:4-(cytidine 5'-diphospho)-2-C-methyl-D-erythritol kinase [Paracoccaceae bacterium]